MYFWAHWCHPCKQLDEVFAELAKDSSQAAFIRVRMSAIQSHYRVLWLADAVAERLKYAGGSRGSARYHRSLWSNYCTLLPCHKGDCLILDTPGSLSAGRPHASILVYIDKPARSMRPMLTTAQGMCSKYLSSVCAPHTCCHPIRIGPFNCLSIPQGGKVVDKVEGADAAAVTRMVQKHCPQSEASSQRAGSIAPPAAFGNGTALHAQAANGGQSLEQRVDQLINKQRVMLFMKVSSSGLNADTSIP